MIEPNELHAIKASVSVALGRVLGQPSERMVLEILNAVDEAAAQAASQRVVMFDAETGEMLLPNEALTGDLWHTIAAQCLPGMPVELVSAAYSAWLESDSDPRPFGMAKRVAHREAASLRGKVTKRIENDGELHSVWVLWDGGAAAEPYSPRELVEVSD